jgi:hypothetical protein
MITPSSSKTSTKRGFRNWVVALLAFMLLIGLGSDWHGRDCTCEQSPAGICDVCESPNLDSAMMAPALVVRPPSVEEPAYVLPTSGRLVITDLEKDHPPPEQVLQG